MAQTIQENDERITIANPSLRTIAERNKFTAQLDDFTTFIWANVDMFANFGAFIINEKKGSLKLYNGPSFKNNYSKPQFQDGYTNLTGITFDTQTISFTIGVYWISIEDYRVLMNLLHPYEINMLRFNFEPTYGYLCKLQGIKDSTRYIVGQEEDTINTTNNNLNYSRISSGGSGSRYRYYTEINLTFEVVGAQCAKSIVPNQVDPQHNTSALTITTDAYNNTYITTKFYNTTTGKIFDWFVSDLDYPFDLKLPSVYLLNPDLPGNLILNAVIRYTYVDTNNTPQTVENTVPVFNITLKNLTVTEPASLKYNSEHGLIYWVLGNKMQSLSLLSTQSNGQRIVSAINVNSFFWPGRLNFAEIINCQVELKLTASSNVELFNGNPHTQADAQLLEFYYTANRRTNII